MKLYALVKGLVRYSWLVALIVTIWANIFIYIFQQPANKPLLFSLLVGSRFLLAGFFNISILVMLHKVKLPVSGKWQKLLRYTTGYLLTFILFLLTDTLERHFTFATNGPWIFAERFPPMLLQAVMTNSLVIITQNFFILQYEKANTDLENSRLKAANLESANLFLKQQVHPHFLFNALSMLKSLYKSDVQAGEAYLSHLVNFLRASLGDSPSKVSSLSDEVKLCNNYLEMQKIRFDNALICTINIPKDVLTQGAVPSFSIQALIENAIKHNEVTETSPLVIRVYYQDGRIITENNLQVRTHIDAPSGKGLVNLIERYRLLSEEEVIIRQGNNTFSVSIKVLNNEDSNHRR